MTNRSGDDVDCDADQPGGATVDHSAAVVAYVAVAISGAIVGLGIGVVIA